MKKDLFVIPGGPVRDEITLRREFSGKWSSSSSGHCSDRGMPLASHPHHLDAAGPSSSALPLQDEPTRRSLPYSLAPPAPVPHLLPSRAPEPPWLSPSLPRIEELPSKSPPTRSSAVRPSSFPPRESSPKAVERRRRPSFSPRFSELAELRRENTPPSRHPAPRRLQQRVPGELPVPLDLSSLSPGLCAGRACRSSSP